MEFVGTLQISHGTRPGSPVYRITFVPADSNAAASSGHRCHGDLALVRLLETLVVDADVRRRALEQIRVEGRASIQPTVLSEAEAARFGLGGRGSGPGHAARAARHI